MLASSVVLLGVWLASMAMSKHELPLETTEVFLGRVLERPTSKPKSYRLAMDVVAYQDNKELFCSNTTKLLAYFQRDSLSEQLKTGDVVVFRASLQLPPDANNPDAFDYRAYLKLKGVHYQVFIPGNNWQWMFYKPPNKLKLWAGEFRSFLLKSMLVYGLQEEIGAITSAILLGYDDLMEDELRQQFAGAGIMHILCVSGLHVGIIYLVLNMLLGFLKPRGWQAILKMLLLLGCIWFYAMITALSPSVLRASLMISLFIIGNGFNRMGDSLNTLAASAFLLLVLDPLLIFHIGFQLSYAAVLSILIGYRPIYGLLRFRNKIVDSCWSVMVVSVVAQMGTFPLAAHYFHFFPNYFLLTNLLVFPLAFLIISCGMLFVAFSWFPLVAAWIAKLLWALVALLDAISFWVSELPYSGSNDLYFPWLKVLLVYLFTISIFYFLIKKKKRVLVSIMVIAILILSFNFQRSVRLSHQKRMVVYAVNGQTAIHCIYGQDHLFLVDSVLYANPDQLYYHTEEARIHWGLDKRCQSLEGTTSIKTASITARHGFISLAGKNILIAGDKNGQLPMLKEKLSIDVLVLIGGGQNNLEEMFHSFQVKQIVVDASVPYWKSQQLHSQAKKLKVPSYLIREKGAFVYEW